MSRLALLLLLGLGTPAMAAEPVKVINPTSFYPESPLWLDDRLLYVEYAAHTLMSWDGKESRAIWKKEGCGPSAVAPFGNDLLITCYDSNTLERVSREGVSLESIVTDSEDAEFIGPNDLAPDGKGGLYVSMSGTFDVKAPVEGTVYHMARDGTLDLVAENIHYANGLALAADGHWLLVAEMLAARVLRFEVLEDGGLGERRIFARLKDLVPDPEGADPYYGPDGIKVDKAGNVYIAQNGGGSVLVTDPAGERLLRQIKVPGKHVTNMGFGATEDTLFVTAAIDPWNAPYPGEVYEVPNR